MPEAGPIVAAVSGEILHTPPPVLPDSVTQAPLQKEDGPEIGPGDRLTVTVVVTAQPAGVV